jgi:hypothetical protein
MASSFRQPLRVDGPALPFMTAPAHAPILSRIIGDPVQTHFDLDQAISVYPTARRRKNCWKPLRMNSEYTSMTDGDVIANSPQYLT